MVVETPQTSDRSASPRFRKVYRVNDPVYGQLEVFYPLNLVIDTPEFQRLRQIHQLGVVFYVYPAADFSRFEHSLGVYHLARRFVSLLRTRQPDLNITDRDVLCVSLAALIHDLGHGPYSHTYDGPFMKAVCPSNGYVHEIGSIRMFERLLNKNPEVKQALDQFMAPEDYEFVAEAINPPKNFIVDGKWALKGRPREKGFLYDLVSNKFDGLDVDKLDYFLRDSHHANVNVKLDTGSLTRLMDHAKVKLVEEQGLYRVCYANKVQQSLSEAIDSRAQMHETVYKHKTVMAYEYMLVEVFRLANDHLHFKGDDGNMYRLSDAHLDMGAFVQLTDHYLFGKILYSESSELEPARQLCTKILKRQHPRSLGEFQLTSAEEVESERAHLLQYFENSPYRNEIITSVAEVHRGKGVGTHPIAKVYFYDPKLEELPPSPPHECQQLAASVPGYYKLVVFSTNLEPARLTELRRVFHQLSRERKLRFEQLWSPAHSLQNSPNKQLQQPLVTPLNTPQKSGAKRRLDLRPGADDLLGLGSNNNNGLEKKARA